MKIKFNDIISAKGTIDRGAYLFWGVLLLFIKYNLDRLISIVFFERRWFITDYIFEYDRVGLLDLTKEDITFYGTLALLSIPFIWVGLVLTVKRLRSLKLSAWLVLFFFVPLLNLFLFALLSIIPERNPDYEKNREHLLSRILPKSKLGSAVLAVVLTVTPCILLTVFSIQTLKEYGWGVFLGIPFFLGFGSVLLYGYRYPVSYRQSIGVTVLALLLFCGLLLLLAIEGVFCIVMAIPIGLIMSLLGATLAYAIQNLRSRQPQHLYSLVLIIPLIAVMETFQVKDPPMLKVETSVLIETDRQQVWDNLISFTPIDEPEEVLFRAGIAYPINATIEGQGESAIRYCSFNTGDFVEPIDIWDEPNKLSFSVKEQPLPMIELTPYKHLDAPHLDGYFQSVKGQFVLKETASGDTELIGMTWYKQKIWPNSYWRLWTDYIVHSVHYRVLEHIKKSAES